MPDSLMLRLAIPAALLANYSCHPQEPTLSRPVAAKSNACVPDEIKRYSRPCKADDADGRSTCYFDSCPLPVDGKCDGGFKPGVISTAPVSKVCSFGEVVDL